HAIGQIADAEGGQQGAGPVQVQLAVRLAPAPPPAVPGGDHHVLRGLLGRDGLGELLAGQADQRAQLEDVDPAQLLAEDVDPARGGMHPGRQQAHQGRLPGAVGAEHRPTLPLPDLKGDRIEDRGPAAADGDFVQGCCCDGHGPSLSVPRPRSGPLPRGATHRLTGTEAALPGGPRAASPRLPPRPAGLGGARPRCGPGPGAADRPRADPGGDAHPLQPPGGVRRRRRGRREAPVTEAAAGRDLVALPRAAVLMLWSAAYLRGDLGPDDAAQMSYGVGRSGPSGEGEDLFEWMTGLRRLPLAQLRLVLPVPGRLAGLVGPPAAIGPALEAEQAIVV